MYYSGEVLIPIYLTKDELQYLSSYLERYIVPPKLDSNLTTTSDPPCPSDIQSGKLKSNVKAIYIDQPDAWWNQQAIANTIIRALETGNIVIFCIKLLFNHS